MKTIFLCLFSVIISFSLFSMDCDPFPEKKYFRPALEYVQLDEQLRLTGIKKINDKEKFLHVCKHLSLDTEEQLKLCQALLNFKQSKHFDIFLAAKIDNLKKNRSTQNTPKKNPFDQLFVRSEKRYILQ